MPGVAAVPPSGARPPLPAPGPAAAGPEGRERPGGSGGTRPGLGAGSRAPSVLGRGPWHRLSVVHPCPGALLYGWEQDAACLRAPGCCCLAELAGAGDLPGAPACPTEGKTNKQTEKCKQK